MNRATRILVSSVGVILALAGIDHGFFEVLQGNTPTGGLIFRAIGPNQMMWKYGGEEAFSIVPNFLASGILSIAVSLAILVWSLGFIHTRHGASVFGALFVLLFLVGGGIAQVVFFLPAWGFATRIHKPLNGWRRLLPEKLRRAILWLWPVLMVSGALSFLVGVFIAITGYVPGESDPERILSICWALVFGGSMGSYLLAFISGFAHDIQMQMRPPV